MKQNLILILSILLMPVICVAQIALVFDDNGNVISESYPNGFVITYQYDANSNRISQSTSGATLPLLLLDFRAYKGSNDVLLEWSTNQEVNTKEFEIQFSKNGIDFIPFDTVSANGNSTIRINYSTIHCCPINGTNYYRLKIVDRNGYTTYSPIRVVVFKNTNTIKIYPNPVAQNELSVSFSETLKVNTILSIYNISGSKVLEKNLQSGQIAYKVNISNLASGTYQLVVHNNSTEGILFIKE